MPIGKYAQEEPSAMFRRMTALLGETYRRGTR